GYKTPWISLNFIVPLAVIGGYAIEQLYRRTEETWVPLSLTGGAIVLLLYGHIVKLRYAEGGQISGMDWDFDLSSNWPYIVGGTLFAAYAGYILYSRSEKRKPSLHFYLALAIALAVCGYQMYELNFVHYDDDQYAYVYAHTRRGLLAMLDEIDRISKQLK